jgi:SAM-dependent methyltransferase
VDVLDRLRREPFYAAYKERLAELLTPVAGGTYLEVGTGTGADALAFAARYGASVVGIDASETMVAEARRRGLERAIRADAAALPFEADLFDGCWADRVFQHLAEPGRALEQLVRVTRPGGRVAVADPDYGTQVVDVADGALARRVLGYRAERVLRNGLLAHRLGGLFVRAGLAGVTAEARTLVVRDPTAVDNVMGLRSWAEHAALRGALPTEDARAWERAFDEAVARGTFLYAVTFFLTAGTVTS